MSIMNKHQQEIWNECEGMKEYDCAGCICSVCIGMITDKTPNWIYEKIPKIEKEVDGFKCSKSVLILNVWGTMLVGKYFEESGWDTDGVRCWMPLPEPPAHK